MQVATNNFPTSYRDIDAMTKTAGFTMPSDLLTCSLLRTLAAIKPAGKFLELGTGTGLGTSWILDGMDSTSTLISIDNDPEVISIADTYLGDDPRLTLVTMDAEKWVAANKKEKFDYIFADSWHGKYLMLDEILAMLNKGGIYLIDDMLPQENWPEGHSEKAKKLIRTLENREDLFITKQVWSTGIILCTKK